MRRFLCAEGLLLVLLAGLHFFVFTRGMGDEGWGSLSNTISLIEDRDLDLANNLLPIPGVEVSAEGTLKLSPAPVTPSEYPVYIGPGSQPEALETPAPAVREPAPPRESRTPPEPVAPRESSAPRPVGPIEGGPPVRPEDPALHLPPAMTAVPPAGPATEIRPREVEAPPSATPPAPPAERPSQSPSVRGGPPPYEAPVYSSEGQGTYPGSGDFSYASIYTGAKGPYEASPVDEKRIVATRKAPLGQSFFDIPFVWAVGKWLGGKELNANATDPYYKELSPKQYAQALGVVISHGFWSVLAVLLLFATFRELDIGRGDGMMATLLVFFSSSLTWYGASGSAHGVSTFTLALALYGFSRYLARLRDDTEKGYYLRWLVLGLLVALAGLVQYVNAFLVPVFVLYLLFDRKSFHSALLRILAFAVGFAALWWLNLYYWSAQYGVGNLTPLWETMQFGHWYLAPVETLCYFKNGFFLFSPLFLFGFVGLFLYLACRAIAPIEFRFAGLSMLCLLAMATASGLRAEWAQSGFGSHLMTPALLFVAIGVGQLLEADDKRFLRYLLALAATAWSYIAFLFARSGIAGSPQYAPSGIQRYWHVFWGKEYPWKRILKEVGGCSHTIKYMLQPGHRGWMVLFALIVVGLLVLCVWLMMARRGVTPMGSRRLKGSKPADRWRTTDTWKE